MKRKSWQVLTIVATLLLATSAVPATALELQPRALVRIDWQAAADVALVETLRVPVYARLESARGPYLLAGATAKQIESLRSDGLDVTILDAEMDGTDYYVASVMPGRPTPDWRAYGRLLIEDGALAVVRSSSHDAERLVEAGVELAAVTLTPKPLRLSASEVLPAAVTWDPLVQAMIDQVTSDQVSAYDRQMAGELPVWVDGDWYTITNRHTYGGVPIEKATRWVGQHMAGLGLDVEYHTWGGATYPNVIGELRGLANPDDVYIIGAHIDAVSGSPGADDNGSGSVAVLLAADIMSQYHWGSTLRFAFWTGEEQGLYGSEAYAQRAYENGETILGYLNLDMIAWNTPDSSPGIDLYYSTGVPGTLAMAQQFGDVIATYDLGLLPGIATNESGSDHASFWQYGYKAILGIEDEDDFNPYYHSSQDTPAHTDLGYFTDFVKASIAGYAHLNASLIPGGLGTLDGHVTAAGSGAPLAGAAVQIATPEGHTYTVTADGSGHYTHTLPAGSYDVTASAYGYGSQTVSGVPVVTDTVTTQNLSLAKAPIFVVKGTVTDSANGSPLAAQVVFEGSPVAVSTDPATGKYRAVLATGTYNAHVSAGAHRPQNRTVVVTLSQIQDFALDPLPCILLVDDDNDAPNTLPYFTSALASIGHDYDVYTTAGGTGPGLGGLVGYKMVLWFSGDAFGGTAGPGSADEGNLASYLDAGGNLFLSSQDYLYDLGLTAFGSSYLGIGSYANDSGAATGITGAAGDPIGDGLGPFSLTYPSGFSDYGDVVSAATGASVAFRAANNTNNLDLDKAGGRWHTVFFGTDWVPLYNNSAAHGTAVLRRVIDWFGGCEVPATAHAGHMVVRWKGARGGRYAVVGTVPILDEAGTGVPGATVSVEWTLPDGSTRAGSAVTDTAGVARFRLNSRHTGKFEMCVTDVLAEGHAYDPDQNLETCEAVTIP